MRWLQALNSSTCYYFDAFLSKPVKRMGHYMTNCSGDNKEVIKSLKFQTYYLIDVQLSIRTGTELFRARCRIFGF